MLKLYKLAFIFFDKSTTGLVCTYYLLTFSLSLTDSDKGYYKMAGNCSYCVVNVAPIFGYLFECIL